MSILPAQLVDMKNFKKLVTTISPEYTVCVRGRHAIGKSEGVYQAATQIFSDFYKEPENCKRMMRAVGGKIKTPNGFVTEWSYELGIPVIERRLSQMTEGDIIGLPFMHGKDEFELGKRVSWASTQFKPCDWLINSCEFPALLFLDERNRALDGVKQAVFQLMDSKVFYGHVLNPETRIVIAENVGTDYMVEQCDPAETSRPIIVQLEPSVEDFLEYIKDKSDLATIEFIQQNPKLLEHTGPHEPDKKYPDRRMWFKLDQELQRLDLFLNPEDDLFRILAGSFLGTEAGTKFQKFCKERERQVSAKEIVTNWKKTRARISTKGSISNEMFVECVQKLEHYVEKNKLTDEQAEQIGLFMFDCPPEACLACWQSLHQNEENLIKVHPFARDLIIARVSEENISNLKPKTIEDVKREKEQEAQKEAQEAAKQKGSKRGGRQDSND